MLFFIYTSLCRVSSPTEGLGQTTALIQISEWGRLHQIVDSKASAYSHRWNYLKPDIHNAVNHLHLPTNKVVWGWKSLLMYTARGERVVGDFQYVQYICYKYTHIVFWPFTYISLKKTRLYIFCQTVFFCKTVHTFSIGFTVCQEIGWTMQGLLVLSSMSSQIRFPGWGD